MRLPAPDEPGIAGNDQRVAAKRAAEPARSAGCMRDDLDGNLQRPGARHRHVVEIVDAVAGTAEEFDRLPAPARCSVSNTSPRKSIPAKAKRISGRRLQLRCNARSRTSDAVRSRRGMLPMKFRNVVLLRKAASPPATRRSMVAGIELEARRHLVELRFQVRPGIGERHAADREIHVGATPSARAFPRSRKTSSLDREQRQRRRSACHSFMIAVK